MVQAEDERLWCRESTADPAVKWCTPVYPRIVWATQDVLTPVSEAAKQAEPTVRTRALACPKMDFKFACEWPLCMNYDFVYPTVPVSRAALVALTTERTQRLAQPKQLHSDHIFHRPQYVFSCGRPSTIWTVSEAAKKAAERSRSTELARPRTVVADYRLPRAVQSTVTAGARTAEATDRISDLAIAKDRSDKEHFVDQFVYSCGRPSVIFKVSDGAKTAQPSERIKTISKPIPLSPEFKLPRPYSVSLAAQNAIPSQRILELARPIPRNTMDAVQFDPECFRVKKAALGAYCSPRLAELATTSRK